MTKYLSVVPLVLLLCFVVGCQNKAALAELEQFKVQAALEEQNNAKLMNVVKRIQEAMDNHDPIAIAQCYSEDATMIMPGEPEPVRGREAIAKNQEAFFRAMPDFSVEFTSLISGNHIVFEGAAEGTFTGPMTTPAGDIPPTGKHGAFKFVFIAKINADGLIEEDRTYYDTADFMKQLGIME